ncbi:MAG: N-formylglutamate deformylase [Woeseiaceae bacterium]
MSEVFDFREGSAPLLVSIPHDGREIPADIAARMTQAGRAMPDTDWHVVRLYAFATALGASVLAARCSRYVIDLNRPPGDEALYPGQLSTGLLPVQSFAGDELYRPDGQPGDAERRSRVARYWRPYHRRLAAELEGLKERFGYALLWDAHSIRGEVPRLFEGRLPDLNLGTNGGASCARNIETAVMRIAGNSAYGAVLNARFRGGFITRHYGAPERGVHAIQLELAQRCYMDETTLHYDEPRAGRVAVVIGTLLDGFLSAAAAQAAKTE